MAARFVCWLALGLHERSHSLHEELGNGPGCVPYVDACDLSLTRIPGDRGDKCLGWIGREAQAFVPAFPLRAWQNDRFDEHPGILRLGSRREDPGAGSAEQPERRPCRQRTNEVRRDGNRLQAAHQRLSSSPLPPRTSHYPQHWAKVKSLMTVARRGVERSPAGRAASPATPGRSGRYAVTRPLPNRSFGHGQKHPVRLVM